MRTAYYTAAFLLFCAVVVPGRLAQGQSYTSPALVASAGEVQFVHEQWTVNDGLPVNNLNDLVQTREGYLWIATWDGLVRFDGVRFTTFTVGNTDGLLSNRIVDLYEERDGVLWGVQAEPGALLRYEDGRFASTQKVIWPDGGAEILGDDEAGRLWIRSGDPPDNVFYNYNGQELVRVPAAEVPSAIAAPAAPPSPWRIEARQHVTYAGSPLFTTPSLITGSVEDREGSFWVATFQDGLHRFRSAPIVTLGIAGGERHLGFTALAEDLSGTLWAKTQEADGSYRLAGDAFVSVPDTAYFAWLRAEQTSGMPEVCRPDHGGLLRDRRGALWSNTYGAGVCRLQDGTWTYFGTEAGFPNPGRVHAIYESHEGALWFLTFGGRLLRYQPAPAPRLRPEQAPAAGRFQMLTTDDGLAADNLRGFYQDADGVIWVGSYGGGLHRIELPEGADLAEARITVLGTREGLYDDVIHAIVEDDQGRLWMSSNRGLFWVRRTELNALAHGAIDRVRSVFYDERDGMRDREANGGGYLPGLKARDGRLYFPTQDGVVRVDPRRVGTNVVSPLVVIEQVATGDTTFLPHDGPARLSPTQRNFEIAYTGLSFLAPEQMRFRYRLEGYDRTWREVGQRRAFYTGVPPGSYTFRVRAMNKDGVWSTEDAVLTLTVVPYFYETVWFYALCGLALLVLGWVGYRLRTRQLRQRQQALEALVAERTEALRAEQARTEAQAEQLRALDKAKSRFFANVTHEFRTPLTLILGPLKSALAGGYGPEALQQTHQMMLRNGQRLLRLINQILDLAKAEAGQLTLEAERQDLRTLVSHEVRAFAPLAERQGLRLGHTVPETPVVAALDAEQFEKVLLNLLSNAFKFTEPGGAVDVTLRRVGRAAEIAVRDTGCGIAPEQLPRLFERFFQTDDTATRRHEGTGIGLALVKEIVELHGGVISVESTPGEGSTFTVRLPLAAEAPSQEAAAWAAGHDQREPSALVPGRTSVQAGIAAEDPFYDTAGENGRTAEAEAEQEDRTTVLIVDDNADVRSFVRSILEPSYRVLEAADGVDGLEQAKTALPDVVVSDVMMPRLDGFALSRALKADTATDCIPVILLTARADTDGEVEGLKTGADDYVTKPFEAEVLRARVAGLIASRQHLRERFSGEHPVLEPAPPACSPFEQGLREIIEAHLSEPEFNPEALADEAALSYDQLYRRLREEQDETPSQFIRRVRVERAARLLEAQAGTVSEVAYAVGFNSLSYFNRSFREHFDCAPSAYA